MNKSLINIRLPDELINKLDQEAREKYSNRTAIITRLIVEHYEKEKKEEF